MITNNVKPRLLTISLVLALGLAGCNDSGTKTSYGKPNVAPLADAGKDQTVYSRDVVTLDGAASSDSDGRIVLYTWTQTDGEYARLADNKVSQPQFTAPEVSQDQTLVFDLAVKDNAGLISHDSVSILVKARNAVDPNDNPDDTDHEPIPNQAPTVEIGQDRQVEANTLIDLIGSGTDSDGTIVKYLWTQVSGPTVTLNQADSAHASFTTPELAVLTDLVFGLAVTDNQGATTSAFVTIQVKPVVKVVANPTHPQAVVIEPDSALLTWEAVEGISKYFICQAHEPIADVEKCDTYKQGKWSRVSDATRYQAYTLRLNEPTYFRIVAQDKYGTRSTGSNEVSVTPLLAKPTRPLNDTGVTTCLNQTNGTCSSPEQDLLFQDAYSGRDLLFYNDNDGHAGFSFTKLDLTGNALDANTSPFACVLDNTTGLMWEIKTQLDDKSLHDSAFSLSEKDIDAPVNCTECAVAELVKQVTQTGYCGFKDWRVPSANELRSIMDYSQMGTEQVLVDSHYFPDIQANDAYITSSPSPEHKYQRPTVLSFNYVAERDFLANPPITATQYKLRLVRSHSVNAQ
jgi:hypothetical protein